MTISPFISDDDLIAFAREFLRGRAKGFRKDIAICLRADDERKHAYFPGLITCIAFADLLSGLYAGKLEGQGLSDLQKFADRFMDPNYSRLNVSVVYELFRHKVAHLGHPYMVFDTATKPNSFHGEPRRRITWTVHASARKPAIQLEKLPNTQYLKRTPTPWQVPYDHRVRVSVRAFATDIVKTIRGPNGYLRLLETDQPARERFAKCMIKFYPP